MTDHPAWPVMYSRTGWPTAGGHVSASGTSVPYDNNAAAADEWACALIRSGTSRVMVVSANQFPLDARRLASLRHRIGGSIPGGGLAGSHYQQNKLAVVAPTRADTTFRFRFFQFNQGRGELAGDLECANSAAAAALFGLLARIVKFDPGGRIQGVNEGTGQCIMFEPDRTMLPWNTTCDVRFLFTDGLRFPVFSGFSRPAARSGVAGRHVDCAARQRFYSRQHTRSLDAQQSGR